MTRPPFTLSGVEGCRIPPTTLRTLPFTLSGVEGCQTPPRTLRTLPFTLGAVEGCRTPPRTLRTLPFTLSGVEGCRTPPRTLRTLPFTLSPSKGGLLRFLLAASLLLLACEPPKPYAGADQRQNAVEGRIEGDVVVSSAARGDVVVLLFDAARPPPPAGTGHPLSFTVVPSDAVFGSAAPGDLGPFTAPFAFSLVPPGDYLVKGFVDANHDFIPWYGVTADVNAGDVGGGAVDVVTRAPRVVTVGLENDVPVPALKVPVSFADSARVPVDRPAFELVSPAGLTMGTTPLKLTLAAAPLDEGVVHEPKPVFLVRLVDDDGDGVPDDANGDGVPDLWPRVVVRKLAGDNPTVDENDLDKNGLLDATGTDYAHVDPATKTPIPADGQPDAVVLAAAFDVGALLPQLLDAQGKVKQAPTPMVSLPLIIKPLALDASTLPRPGVLAAVPSGRYAVTVIQSTGQTWRVPNELTPGVAEAVGLPAVPSQAALIVVP